MFCNEAARNLGVAELLQITYKILAPTPKKLCVAPKSFTVWQPYPNEICVPKISY